MIQYKDYYLGYLE